MSRVSFRRGDKPRGFISRIYARRAARFSRPQQSEAIYKLIGYDSLRALLSHLGPLGFPPPSRHPSLNLFRLVCAHAHLIGSSISHRFALALYRKLYARIPTERILKPFENEAHVVTLVPPNSSIERFNICLYCVQHLFFLSTNKFNVNTK